MNDEKMCCMCHENKKFLARINAGKKWYCLECERKITESGMNYWKPCSFEEFLKNFPFTKKLDKCHNLGDKYS